MGRSYIFTNKNHPIKGIISTILGVISLASLVIAVFLCFREKGIAPFRYGTAVFMATLMAFAGFGTGIASRMEKDKFYLFSYLGIVFNFLTLAGSSFILYAGAYGL